MKDPAATLPPRYWSLDILRGVCALIVFLNHWILWSDFTPSGVIETGVHRTFATLYDVFVAVVWPTGGVHPAVLCFFVLSGFCVHGPFERRLNLPGASSAAPRWRDYFLRRTRRIMPVYWAGALLGLVAVAVERWHPSGNLLLMLHTSGGAGEFAARLLGYGALWPREIFAGNYSLVTVAVEILVYLFYPLFFLGAARNRWWLLGAVAIGLQLAALALRNIMDPFVLFSGILVMALFWYLGALAAHLRHRQGWRVRGWWVGAACAAFLAAKLVPYFLGMNMIKQLILGLVCMLLIVWLLDWEQRYAAQRERPWARFLRWSGDISYPLYAMHTPVILLVNWAMCALPGGRDYGWQLTCNLVVSLGVSVVVHHAIEKRFYRPRT